ncbi:hypothetical protein LX36DRAFT_256867 [Colletotrichum falcatum]|nr:hypothetical protein LX36DRAFT_256867 [Colletotrichum falcatum]
MEDSILPSSPACRVFGVHNRQSTLAFSVARPRIRPTFVRCRQRRGAERWRILPGHGWSEVKFDRFSTLSGVIYSIISKDCDAAQVSGAAYCAFTQCDNMQSAR